MIRACTSVSSFALITALVAACGGDDPPPTSMVTPPLDIAALNITPSAALGTVDGAAGVDGGGDATYSIPIEVAPGIAGIQPSLALEYSSSAGDGFLGVGWRLSGLSAITSCGQTLREDGVVAPPEISGATVVGALCLDGQRLELVSGTAGEAGAEYRPRLDPYTRVDLQVEDNPDPASNYDDIAWFRAWGRDGLVYTYGRSSRTRRMADADTMLWALEKVEDRWGNNYTITYDIVEEESVDNWGVLPFYETWTTEFLPLTIDYTAAFDPVVPHQMNPGDRRVRFVYEDRPDGDRYEVWSAGIREQLRRRLKEIRVDVAGTRVRTYRLAYANDSLSGRSRILNVTECDHLNVCLPPTRFEWELGELSFGIASWPGATGWSDAKIDLTEVERKVILDLDHDGHDEILFTYGTWPWQLEHWQLWDPDDDQLWPVAQALGTMPSAALQPAAITFNGDVYTDVLVPIADPDDCGTCMDDTLPQAAYAYATRLQVLHGQGDHAVSPVFIDDGPGRIFIVAPGDFDGDTLTDAWLCRGEDAGSTTWALALNRPGGPERTFELVETEHQCTPYEWYLVLDQDGDGADDLLVHDLELEVSDWLWDSDPFNPVVFPSMYHTLDWGRPEFADEDAPPTVLVRDSGLFPDVSQRIERAVCHPDAELVVDDGNPWNGPPEVIPYERLWPYHFVGPGPDKVADVNGDGLDDVIRLERVEDPGNPGADHAVWVGDDGFFDCLADTEMSFEVKVWFNSSRGFYFDPGVAAIHFDDITPWQAMRRFEMMSVADINLDGRADLLTPVWGDADGTAWEARVVHPGGTGYETVDLGIDAAWDHPEVWDFEGDDVPTEMYSFDGGDTFAPDLLVLTGANGDAVPTGFRSLSEIPDHITAVVDGFGARDEFVYGFASDPELHVPGQGSSEYAVIESGLMVREHRTDLGLPGVSSDAYTSHAYKYWEGRVDRGGRGGLGFSRTRVSSTAVDPGTAAQTPSVTTETWFDQSYDANVTDYPRAGRPVDVVTEWVVPVDGPMKRLVDHEHDTYEVRQLGDTYAVFPTVARQRRIEITTCDFDPCRPHELDGASAMTDVTTTRAYDDWANVESELVRTAQGHEHWTQTTWTIDELLWLIARPERVVVTDEAADGSFVTRTTDFVYAPGTNSVKTQLVEPLIPAEGLKTDFTRDPRGLVTEVRLVDITNDPRITKLDWGDGYFVQKVTNALLQDEYFIHHKGLGVLTHYQEAAGVVNEATFDGFGRYSGGRRRSAWFSPTDGADTAVELLGPGTYDGSRMQIRETSLTGARITYDVDRLGREIRAMWLGLHATYDGRWVYRLTSYDTRGQVATISVPQYDGVPPVGYHFLDFDEAGRVSAVTDPAGHKTTWTYRGLLTKVTDTESRLSTFRADERGDIVESINAEGTSTCLDRGPFGLIAKVRRNCGTNPDGPKPAATVYTRDRFGRATKYSDPTLGNRLASFNGFGERISTTDAKNQVVTYTYDKLGRVTGRNNVTEGLTSYTWDTNRVGVLAFTHSPGNVDRVYNYDGFGRIDELDVTVNGANYEFAMTYDAHGRVDVLRYPTPVGEPTFSVKYSYDFTGRLRKLRHVEENLDLWRVTDGDAPGHVTKELFGNGLTMTSVFDPLSGWLEGRITAPAAGPAVQNDVYEWTPSGDLDWRRDDVHGQLEDLRYDAMHRLISSSVSKAGTTVNVGVTYDRLGNITAKSDVGAYTYDSRLRLTKAGTTTYTWDANGDAISRNGSAIAYNTFGKPKTMAAGGLAFTYDANHDRVRRTGAGGVQQITLDDLYELDTSAAPHRHKYFVRTSDYPVAQVTRTKVAGVWSSSYEYLHRDHLGTPVVITDEGGVASQRLAFDAWGARRDAANWTNPIPNAIVADVSVGYTGHPLRVDGELVDMGARLYDPKVGRFMSPDPLVANPLDGETYTPYAYVANNPLSLRDPTGMQNNDGPSGGNGDEDDEDPSDDCTDDGCTFPDEPVDGDKPDPPAPPPAPPGGSPGGDPGAPPPPPVDPSTGGGEGDGGGWGFPSIPMPTIPFPDFPNIPAPVKAAARAGVLGYLDGYTWGASTWVLGKMGVDVPTDSLVFQGASMLSPAGAGKKVGKAALKQQGKRRAGKGSRAGKVIKNITLTIPLRKEWADAVRHAIQEQGGLVGKYTVDRAGRDARRSKALKGQPTISGYDRDEWPPAMFKESGAGPHAHVLHLDISANRGLGKYIGLMTDHLDDGSIVTIEFDKGWLKLIE